ELLLDQFSLTKIQRLQSALFEEKRSSEEKTAHLLSRVDPLLESISIDDVRKFVLFSSLPDSVKQHVAPEFDSLSVHDFQRRCDVLLDIKHGKSQHVAA
ncbi:Hypothetical predicted protein, partial [Paramuricea clavata]